MKSRFLIVSILMLAFAAIFASCSGGHLCNAYTDSRTHNPVTSHAPSKG